MKSLVTLAFILPLCLCIYAGGTGFIKLDAGKSYAPFAPPPITRKQPARLSLIMNTTTVTGKLSEDANYTFWAIDGSTPGPMIRARVGDILDVTFTNAIENGPNHNIDFHAIVGPGGGGTVLHAKSGQTRSAKFSLLYPGLYIYHCGVTPAPYHVANGAYGLILVEPEQGLPKVDKEFYIVKSEFYSTENVADGDTVLKPDYLRGLDERPTFVVFNGRVGSLVEEPLKIKTGDKVRIFFGNAGPNLPASFHVIGTVFDNVYREGDLISPPARGIQTTLVPAGGSVVVEFQTFVPGTYTIVDHSIFRVLKGAVGFIKAEGPNRVDLYCSTSPEFNVTCYENELLKTM